MDYWVGLGSNVGDGNAQIDQALDRLAAIAGVTLLEQSSRYRTPPWGRRQQPDFINAVARLRSALAPLPFLQLLVGIEDAMGRDRSVGRWGPRVIDLDVLLADEQILHLDGLIVPHPRMHRRAFVLNPLAELAPDLVIPARGRVRRLLSRLGDQGVVRLPGGGARRSE